MANKEQITVADTNIEKRMTNVFQRKNAKTNRVLGGDDALQVFVNQENVNFGLTKATSKALLRKIDLTMMPVSLVSAVHDAEVEPTSCSSWYLVWISSLVSLILE